MFKIVHKITAENLLRNKELKSGLDERFFLNYKISGTIHNKLLIKIGRIVV